MFVFNGLKESRQDWEWKISIQLFYFGQSNGTNQK